MSEDVSSQTNPDDVEALTSLATDDAGDAVEPVEAAQADATESGTATQAAEPESAQIWAAISDCSVGDASSGSPSPP